MKPKILVYGGAGPKSGTGPQNLLMESRKNDGKLNAEIVAFASTNPAGGMFIRAEELKVPFIPLNYSGGKLQRAAAHQTMVRRTGADLVALSGFEQKLYGHDPRRTINIHPGLLSVLDESGKPKFGGKNKYGDFVHELVAAELAAGRLAYTGFSMHFATGEYDEGPVFFEYRIPLQLGMTAVQIRALVNAEEHRWQPYVTDYVAHGKITWDGEHKESLRVPSQWRITF